MHGFCLPLDQNCVVLSPFAPSCAVAHEHGWGRGNAPNPLFAERTVMKNLLPLLLRLEHGGFCRDSTTAQCPACGAYGTEKNKPVHEVDCQLKKAIEEAGK